ncbi:MAG: hypothetical protein ACOCT9_01805 [archaeon]
MVKREEKDTQQEDQNYLDKLYQTFSYSISKFDRNVLFISSGALGLSVTIIDSILNLDLAVYKFFLFFAWYLLAFTILLSLYSHMVSYQLTSKIIQVTGQDKEEELRDKYNRRLSNINKLMLITLIMGIISFLLFINLNFV